jgi:hypothetical protein
MQDGREDAERKSFEPPVNSVAGESEPEPERDRRGVVLPARQRVGGIITPQ